MKENFTYTPNQNPHALRSREIIKKYPQVRQLFEPYPISGVYIILISAAQLLSAYILVSTQAHFLVILLWAYLFGALCNHALFVFVHEATHDAINRSKNANKLWGILANVAQVAPSAMSFRTFHLLHHSNLNEYDVDADLAYHWEARLVKNSWWRKTLWLMFFFIIEIIRPARLKKGKTFNAWSIFNIVFILATNVAIYFWIGPYGFIYLLMSTLFSVGLHPVGARWIQEHYTYKEAQETYSYYGPLNRLQFNIGYHNEHHDFYRIPWIHLPKLRKMAPEFYDNLYYHTSWTKLLLDFIFNPKRDLYLRIVRDRSIRVQKTERNSSVEDPSFAK